MKRKIENPFLYVEVSDRGAELMRIMRKDTGAEILWNGDPAFWSYRSPILFPNVGSTWQKKSEDQRKGNIRPVSMDLPEKRIHLCGRRVRKNFATG